MDYHARAVVMPKKFMGLSLRTGAMSILICLLLLLPTVVFAEADALAVKSADTFLKGVKLIQLPEGKKMIADTAWKSLGSYPVFTEASILFEDMFQTDVQNIKGFKRLMEIKVVSKGSTPLLKQYLLVSYKNPNTNQWKVFGFREATDSEFEMQAACKDPTTPTEIEQKLFGSKFNSKVKYKYRRCGYWSSLAGKLNQAKEAYAKASELNKQDTEDKKPQNEFDDGLEIIMQIIQK